MRSLPFLRRLAARLDDMVSQVENHEAIADSALRTARERLARANRALERAARDAETVTSELRSQEELAGEARRMAAGEKDDGRAIEWLRRARRAGRAALNLETDRRTFIAATSALECEVGRLEDQLSSLERTRNLLHAREKRAEVLQAVAGDRPPRDDGLLAVIQRWEAQVQNAEVAGQAALEFAALDANGFDDESELMHELAELRRNAT